MGNAPIEMTEKESTNLKESIDDACLQAANIIKGSDILLVCIGDGLSSVDKAHTGLMWDPLSNVERFYGIYGEVFNNVRKEPLQDSLSVINEWRHMFTGTEVDKEMQRLLEEEQEVTGNVAWKSQLNSTLSTTGDVIDLVNGDDCDSDDEVMANLQFESFEPKKTGAFYAFTSSQSGCAAKLWGHSAVRECRGSIQQWQCGSVDGPCRDQDVWEAPDGFSFMLSGEDGEIIVAPSGLPRSRPPVFKVNMHNPVCMDRALSVAAAFRTNHPICRSCSGPARPAMSLTPGDCDWVDVRERAMKYSKWRRAVKHQISSKNKNLVVLEIGCSPPLQSDPSSFINDECPKTNVSTRSNQLLWTTVRQESEAIVSDLNAGPPSSNETTGEARHGATLIRINDRFPLVDRSGDSGLKSATISIALSASEAIQKIDQYLHSSPCDI